MRKGSARTAMHDPYLDIMRILCLYSFLSIFTNKNHYLGTAAIKTLFMYMQQNGKAAYTIEPCFIDFEKYEKNKSKK